MSDVWDFWGSILMLLIAIAFFCTGVWSLVQGSYVPAVFCLLVSIILGALGYRIGQPWAEEGEE